MTQPGRSRVGYHKIVIRSARFRGLARGGFWPAGFAHGLGQVGLADLFANRPTGQLAEVDAVGLAVGVHSSVDRRAEAQEATGQ